MKKYAAGVIAAAGLCCDAWSAAGLDDCLEEPTIERVRTEVVQKPRHAKLHEKETRALKTCDDVKRRTACIKTMLDGGDHRDPDGMNVRGAFVGALKPAEYLCAALRSDEELACGLSQCWVGVDGLTVRLLTAALHREVPLTYLVEKEARHNADLARAIAGVVSRATRVSLPVAERYVSGMATSEDLTQLGLSSGTSSTTGDSIGALICQREESLEEFVDLFAVKEAGFRDLIRSCLGKDPLLVKLRDMVETNEFLADQISGFMVATVGGRRELRNILTSDKPLGRKESTEIYKK